MGAFNELVLLFQERVINTCYRFLLNREDAEDISQEVFVEVYQSISTFRADAKLSTWIYRIAVTKSLDEIKKRNRKKRISSMGKVLHLDGLANWIIGGESPDKMLYKDEKMKAVMQALDILPDSQRIAFTLSKIDGYTNAEIAAIMDTTIIAVESLVSRAKRKVSAELEIILQK
jgi:RNA polymerase sigma-70 factor (ECF subfamily)